MRYKDRSITLTAEQIMDSFEVEPQRTPFMTPSRSMPLIEVIPDTGNYLVACAGRLGCIRLRLRLGGYGVVFEITP